MLALEKKYHGKIEFVIVNVDTEEGQSLARQYNVNSIPAVFLSDKKGNVTYTAVGAKPQEELDNEISKIIVK